MPINAVFALFFIVVMLIAAFHFHQFKCDTFFLLKKTEDNSDDYSLIRAIEHIYHLKKQNMHYFALSDWYNEMNRQLTPLFKSSVSYAVQDDTITKHGSMYPFDVKDYIFIYKGDTYYFDSNLMKSELITEDHPKWYLMFQMH